VSLSCEVPGKVAAAYLQGGDLYRLLCMEAITLWGARYFRRTR